MIPWNLIISGVTTGYKTWSNRRAEMKQMKHQVAMQELANGNQRAKRKLSALVDIILGLFVLAPFAIIVIAALLPQYPILIQASDYINNAISKLPAEYWYGFYMVVGGNFGVSVSNILSNKQIVKKINKDK